jgi:hypothetical protein
MDIITKYRLIRKLKNVVENEGSSLSERENARLRIIEIEEKIKEYLDSVQKKAKDRMKQVVSSVHFKKPNKKNTFSNLKRKLDDGVSIPVFPIDLAFGWNGESLVEISTFFDDVNKVILMEWKCPCCGRHVERMITKKHRARLMGKSDGIKKFIEGIRVGSINQLCDECYEKYR